MADTADQPQLTRAAVYTRLRETDQALQRSIADYTQSELQAIAVTPEWDASDMLRHIWVWAELATRCLDNWLGSRDWVLTFAAEPTFNEEMVQERAAADLPTILAGIAAAYSTYDHIVEHASDEELHEVAPAPWGQPVTRLQMIQASLGHDQHHIGEIVRARNATATTPPVEYQKDSHCSYCGTPYVLAQPWPRKCLTCGNTSYRNPLPVAVVLVPVDVGVLVVRRAIPPHNGLLALPGGFIGLGESWQAAGAREVAEETGLSLAPEEISDLYTRSAPDGTVLVFGVAAPRSLADLPPFTPNHEASERLVVDSAVELAFPLHTAALQRFFAQRS